MNLSSEHLLESVLILMVFYLTYRIFFIRQSSLDLNRYFLLAGIISSILLPFINFSAPETSQLDFYIRLKTVDIFGAGSVENVHGTVFSFNRTIAYLYVTGVIILAVRFIFQLISMSGLFLDSRIVNKSGTRLIYTGKNHPVFSFLTFVFIGTEPEKSKELDIILDHEQVHIEQMHSIDLLLLELLAIVQWFNPILWLYRKQVKQNHEFLADRAVIKAGIPDQTYQEILLGNYKSLKLGFANSFNHSLTLKRLVMMKKSSSNKISAYRLIFVVPLILASVYLISCSNEQEIKNDLQNTENKVSKDVENQNEDLLMPPPPPPPPPISEKINENDGVKIMPVFPGGEAELINFLAKNTKYPVEAKEKGIQGKVFVHFLINKSGKVEKVEVIRGINPYLDNEALRVVNSLPAWKPGLNHDGQPIDVHYTIPISFKLQ